MTNRKAARSTQKRTPRGPMNQTMPRGASTPKGGQPAYAPTAAQREEVTIASAFGISHEDISIGLAISRQTLEKHFAHELTHGAYAKRAQVMQALTRKALEGNVAACKALMQRPGPMLAVPPQPTAPAADEKQPKAKAAKLGKKEQAQLDATTASRGTGWDSLLQPAGSRLQ